MAPFSLTVQATTTSLRFLLAPAPLPWQEHLPLASPLGGLAPAIFLQNTARPAAREPDSLFCRVPKTPLDPEGFFFARHTHQCNGSLKLRMNLFLGRSGAAVGAKLRHPGSDNRSAQGKPLSNVWLAFWASLLALVWLLPNHYAPWTSFHSDAWSAGVFLLVCFVVFLRTEGQSRWPHLSGIILVLLPLPLIQHWGGLMPFASDVWMVSAYLMAMLLAIQLGSQWEAGCPDQAMDGIALGIGAAGVVSVAIQVAQWLGASSFGLSASGEIEIGMWLNAVNDRRAFANVGQPNLLGTLLLWSVLSVAWGMHRRMIGPPLGLFLAAWLLFGVALTQSRTAWIGATALVALAWYWLALWRSKWIPITASLLGAYLAVSVAMNLTTIDWGQPTLAVTVETSRLEAGLRPAAWRMLLGAVAQRPWFGYGWEQGAVAQLSVAEQYPPLFITFNYSHNLFLDLVLWCGLPLGLLVSGLLVRWAYVRGRQVNDRGAAIRMLFLVVVGIHSMLEFPLYYAMFLLPTAVIAGTLDAHGNPANARPIRLPLLTTGVAAAVFLAVVVRDYIGHVEQNFQAMRFELARIPGAPKYSTPDVILLTHLREWLRLARFEPHSGMSEADIEWVRAIALRFPSGDNFLKLARALAVTGRTAEASAILMKSQRMLPQAEWPILRFRWLQAAKNDAAIASLLPELSK